MMIMTVKMVVRVDWWPLTWSTSQVDNVVKAMENLKCREEEVTIIFLHHFLHKRENISNITANCNDIASLDQHNNYYKIYSGHPRPTLPGLKFKMFLWEVSWAPSSLDFDENTWHCHIHPASWSNKRVTLVVLLINAQPCSYWVNIATGANYPAMELIGPILPEVDTFPEKYLKIREMSMLWILSLSLFQSLTHSF